MSGVFIATDCFRQNPKFSYCSLNAIRSVLSFYHLKDYGRKTILKHLKTHKTMGTSDDNIEKTLHHFKISFKKRKSFSWKLLTKHISSMQLILVSYKSAPSELHTSIINGFSIKEGIKVVRLCDSLYGYIDIPFDVMRVLIDKESVLYLKI